MGTQKKDFRATEIVNERFHSISFPSEWGPSKTTLMQSATLVSIQLVSPASGDVTTESREKDELSSVSIQLVSPASGDSG